MSKICKSFLFIPIALLAVSLFNIKGINAKSRFEMMDRNGDGQVSSSEFRGKQPAFKRMDKNNDGYISKSEASGTPLLQGQPNQGHRGKSAVRVIESDSASSSDATPSIIAPSRNLIYIDTHNHIFAGPNTGNKSKASAANLINSMNATGVKVSFIMPMPQGYGQNINLKLDDLLPIVK